MADYRSTLTGTQMDAALLDMAEHNSEAYAVGERNGIAVASDDVTYHNNARYYAQIASSQIVGDASSAVRWDTDQSEALTSAQKAVARNNIGAASDSDVVKITAQTLTSAQQAQARANIMAGGSNPNLLDNPWFTVNQRGTTQTSSGNSYIADRWVVSGNTYTWTYARAALSVTNASGSIAYLFQKLPSEVYADINGKTVTYSVMINGTVYSVPFTWDTTKRNAAITIDGLTGIMFWYGDQNQPCLRITVGGTWTVNAIKLELGSVSTLANDAPPDYGTELLKCQRYFLRINAETAYGVIGTAYISAANNALMLLNINMRARPTTVTTSGTFRIMANGTSYSGVVLTADKDVSNSRVLRFSCYRSAAGLTVGQAALVTADNNAASYIDISADL